MTLKNLRQSFEKATGLPRLESLSGMTDKIPDKESLELYVKLLSSMPDKDTMRELNKFLVNAEKLSRAAPDLQMVCNLLGMLKDVDFTQINEALAKLESLVKKGEKLGLSELMAELGKGGE